MNIEYLIIIKDNSSFCADKKSFLKFLEVDSKFKVKGDSIIYENDCTFQFKLLSYKNKDKIKFEIILKFSESIKDTEIRNITKKLRTNILKINPDKTSIKILWNDLGIKYCNIAHPIINNLENLMRKLISKFMLINVGASWISTSAHEDTLKKFKSRQTESDIFLDEVFQMDFIELSDILFKKYRTLKINDLDKLIESAKETINKDKIIGFLPKSNWERHFDQIIKKDEDSLRKAWSELYNIRNFVAHNKFINYSELERLKAINKGLEPILLEALSSLDKINLTKDEKEETQKSLYSKNRVMRLSKVAREYGVEMSTIVNELKQRGHHIDSNPNAKLAEKEIQIFEKLYGQVLKLPKYESAMDTEAFKMLIKALTVTIK